MTRASRQDITARPARCKNDAPSACFIQSVKDDLVGEGGIMDLWSREARLFKYGSGTSLIFQIRGEGELLSEEVILLD